MFVGLTVLLAPAWSPTWITIPSSSQPLSKANWIWVSPNSAKPATTSDGVEGSYWIKKEFEGTGEAGSFQISADNSAKVFLNGELVGENNDWSRLSKIPIRTKKGINIILIQATNDKATGARNPGGIVASLATPKQQVSTDGTWTWGSSRQEVKTPVTVIGDFNAAPWSLSVEAPASPLLRRSTQLSRKVKSARVKVIGLGDYVLKVNGKELGDTVFNQPWSQYNKTIYYHTYDVTKLLKNGENVFAAMLGNSFWNVNNPPSDRYIKGDVKPMFDPAQQYLFAFECDVTFQDGSHQIIKSDASWKWSPSPIVFSHIYSGEDYDARRIQSGWDRPGFSEKTWNSTKLAVPPKAYLMPQFWNGIRVKQTFVPVKTIRRAEDRWSFDFGQNCSGIVAIEVIGKSGQTVVIKPSEVMTKEGDVEQLNLWGGRAICQYTLNGVGTEKWQPTFFYHGQQFVEIKGAVPAGKPNPLKLPVLKSIKLLHTRQDSKPTGSFTTSSKLYNQTYSLVDWAMKSNMSHVMSDCPHREKLGWLECGYLLAPTFSYAYDTRAWMEKILADIRDAQLADGRVMTTAPIYLQQPPSNAFGYTVEWGAAGVLLPWHMYEWYGDKASLARSYASMKAFTDQIAAVSPNGIAPAGLGDWYDYGHGQGPGPSRFTPQDLTATATYAMCVEKVLKSAQLLNQGEDAIRYEALLAEIKEAFLAKFYNEKAKTCRNNGSCQAGNAMALEANLIPEDDRKAVLENIIADLKARNFQQTPGDIGHVYFIRALAKAGRSDVLHKVYSRTGIGSYGGIIAKGLTALPETWDAINTGSNSLNHCMLGHVNEWFYAYVLGVRQAEGSLGWSQILIEPEPGTLSSANGSITTPKGKIDMAWTNSSKGFVLNVTIPKGAAATIQLPKGAKPSCIVKKDRALTEPMTRFQVGEGTYRIEPYRPGMEREDEEEHEREQGKKGKSERERERERRRGKG